MSVKYLEAGNNQLQAEIDTEDGDEIDLHDQAEGVCVSGLSMSTLTQADVAELVEALGKVAERHRENFGGEGN
jgi:hypothetical protein